MEEDDYDADEEEQDDDENDEHADLRVNPPVTLALHEPSEDRRSREYELPDLELLEEPEDFPYEELAKKARLAAATLEKTFEQFGLNIRVSQVDTGPVITQFELELEPGLAAEQSHGAGR